MNTLKVARYFSDKCYRSNSLGLCNIVLALALYTRTYMHAIYSVHACYPRAAFMQWAMGVPRIVAYLHELLTTFTICSRTSQLCCTTKVHSLTSYWGCGKVFHRITSTYTISILPRIFLRHSRRVWFGRS